MDKSCLVWSSAPAHSSEQAHTAKEHSRKMPSLLAFAVCAFPLGRGGCSWITQTQYFSGSPHKKSCLSRGGGKEPLKEGCSLQKGFFIPFPERCMLSRGQTAFQSTSPTLHFNSSPARDFNRWAGCPLCHSCDYHKIDRWVIPSACHIWPTRLILIRNWPMESKQFPLLP